MYYFAYYKVSGLNFINYLIEVLGFLIPGYIDFTILINTMINFFWNRVLGIGLADSVLVVFESIYGMMRWLEALLLLGGSLLY